MSQAALIGRSVVSRYLFGFAVDQDQRQVALFTVNKHWAFPVIHGHVSCHLSHLWVFFFQNKINLGHIIAQTVLVLTFGDIRLTGNNNAKQSPLIPKASRPNQKHMEALVRKFSETHDMKLL
jgi:hypothetical protein